MATKAKTIKLDLSVFSDAELRSIELEIADRRKKIEQASREKLVSDANTRLAEIKRMISVLVNESEKIVDTAQDADVYVEISIGDTSQMYNHRNQYWESSSY